MPGELKFFDIFFWKCSGKNLNHRKWLKEAIEAGAAGADVDVKEMLGALKNAAAGEDVGENLEYVAEFCEVRFFSYFTWFFREALKKSIQAYRL